MVICSRDIFANDENVPHSCEIFKITSKGGVIIFQLTLAVRLTM